LSLFLFEDAGNVQYTGSVLDDDRLPFIPATRQVRHEALDLQSQKGKNRLPGWQKPHR
jgi:hypothetical protein